MRSRFLLGSWFVTLALAALGCGGPVPESDAGGDAFARDVGLDAAECASAADCDDGLFCNGSETCAGGRCVAGALACDDGIDCTLDVCSEGLRSCTFDVPDLDDDGYGDDACLDLGGVPLGNDCDDEDETTFPGNREICDADHDEDCNPDTHGEIDSDSDGFEASACCNPDPDETMPLRCGLDCDDARAATNPTGTETCDLLDQDCDGRVDEELTIARYWDVDLDGFGDGMRPPESVCPTRGGFSDVPTDCNDADPTVSPGLPELCDAAAPIDNNCDGSTTDTPGDTNWYTDLDGDGFGSPTSGITRSCTPVDGASLRGTDCNDARADVSPGQAERCDGIDDDCNGQADFLIGPNNFEDDDGDGLVDIACTPFGTDCDDTNPATGPGERESCDGRDNDCDMNVDEGATSVVYYLDGDRDGYGSVSGGSIVACMPTAGYVERAGDCSDADATRFPGATETCDGQDDDCDSAVDEAPAVSSCGAISHGTPACVSGGTCGIGGCAIGYEDCDGDPSNGCEVHLSDDPSHCGRCDLDCLDAPRVTTATCTAGRCAVTVCAVGFGDCNAFAADGCEITTTTDAAHCGSCPAACSPGQFCASGACAVSCSGALIACTGACVDPRTDLTYCGASGDCLGANRGTTCASGDLCNGGVCIPGSYISPSIEVATRGYPEVVLHTIDTPDAATIIYTLDGTIPGVSGTTMMGAAPRSLALPLGTTVRWYAAYAGGAREAVTHQYIVTNSGAAVNLGEIVESLNMNAQGPVIGVAPGAAVTGSVSLQHWRSGPTGYCPGCVIVANLGVDGVGQVECHPMTSGVYPGTTAPVSFSFTAPTTRGRYYIRAGMPLDYTCGTHAGGSPIGVIYVR